MAFTAFLDTCVLVPSTVRDLLLEAASHQAFRALWSTGVETELKRVITKLHNSAGKDPDETSAYITRLLVNMNKALPDARVTGYEWMEGSIRGIPDADDRHIVAAAAQGQASVIVTFNIRDFPSEALPGALFSQSPDDFLPDLFDLSSQVVHRSLQKIAARTGRRGPTWSVNDLLGRLVNEGVPQFCSAFHRDNKGANTRNLPRIKPSGSMDIDQLLDETRGER